MVTKPDLLTWVPDDDVAKIEDPGTTKKANGFLYLEKPPFQFFNFIFNSCFKWFRGIQGRYAHVVVGSSAQKTAHSATHLVTELSNVTVPQGTKVLFLEGTHTLTANITLTNADCSFEMENGAAVIDLGNTYKLALNGARAFGLLRVANAPNAADACQATGADARLGFIGVLLSRVTTNLMSKLLMGSDEAIQSLMFTTGDVKGTYKTTPDAGWIFMDDGSIGNAASSATTRANADTEALFTLLWNVTLNLWCPVQTSAGVFTTRGASAAADFAANRRLVMPKMLGRALIAGGTGSFITLFTVNPNDEMITIDSNSSIYTGATVQVSSTGTLPGGLSAATNYFAIRINATTIQLAATLALAHAGTPINITSNGSGVHTMVMSLVNKAHGSHGGEEAHSQTVNEGAPHGHGINQTPHAHGVTDPGHLHQVPYGQDLAGGAGFGRVDLSGFNRPTSQDVTNISIQGGNANVSVVAAGLGNPSNIMMPYSAANIAIRL